MSTAQPFLLLFLLSASVHFWQVINGFDDILAQVEGRKPTGQEGIRRIGYVLVRACAAASGGYLLAGKMLIFIRTQPYTPKFLALFGVVRDDPRSILHFSLLVLIFSSFLSLLLLRLAQNTVRKFQGRNPRPWIDWTPFRRTFGFNG